LPKIPQYESRESIQVRTVTEEAPGIRISPEDLTITSKAVSQFGITVQNIAEDIIKVKADQEYAQAKIESYKALSQIESEAAGDNDFQNFEPKYSKKIQEIKDNITQKIKSPLAKQEFQQDFDLKSIYAYHDIMANGRRRFLDYDKDLMNQEIALAKERYFTASTPGEKQNAKDELGQIFSRRIENKILNKAEGANLHQKIIAGLDEDQAGEDIILNPQYALDQLTRKDSPYKNLTKLKRAELIDKAQQQIDKQMGQLSRQQLITYAQNEDKVCDSDINGNPLNADEIKNLRDRDLIRSSFALSKIKALNSAKAINAKTDNKTFEDIFGNIIRRDIPATEIREKIYNANAQGKLNTSDMRRLLFAEKGEGVNSVFEDFVSEQEKLVKTKKVSKPVNNFWGIVNDMVSVVNPLNTTFLLGKIFDRAKKENVMDERLIGITKDEIRKQILIDKPEISKLPESGHLYRDKFGNTAIVYPDGTYEEVQSKTGEFIHPEYRKKK
jgi:hypothetical protein